MPESLLSLLQSEPLYFDKSAVARASAVVGFDGFVDEMAGVVSARSASGQAELVPSIAAFGQLVSDAAGRSFGRELAVKRVEAGGNAPNLADGLSALGMQVDFFGTLGDPIDPVFEPFAQRCRSCATLGPCGRTLALEFGDGKLMLNNTSRLGALTTDVMGHLIDEGAFARRCAEARLLGFANWSRYPHMTSCWRLIADRVLATLTHRPWLIVDLADPSGRSSDDIRDMLAVVRSMTGACRVVFGANLNEAGVLLRALGQAAPPDDAASMASAADELRERTGVHMFALHSQRRCAGAWSDASSRAAQIAIEGAYNPRPVRTTGVGDRFNAGLGAALVAGLPPDRALALGCAAGAWFVTVGRPLEAADLPELTTRLR